MRVFFKNLTPLFRLLHLEDFYYLIETSMTSQVFLQFAVRGFFSICHLEDCALRGLSTVLPSFMHVACVHVWHLHSTTDEDNPICSKLSLFFSIHPHNNQSYSQSHHSPPSTYRKPSICERRIDDTMAQGKKTSVNTTLFFHKHTKKVKTTSAGFEPTPP